MAEDFLAEVIEANYSKCKNCGSNLEYNPEKKCLSCSHCGSVFEIEDTGKVEEMDLLKGIQADQQWENKDNVAFLCENCGAKVVLFKGESAKVCPFCGTSHVIEEKELSGIKPMGVIPFAFGIDTAIDYVKQWIKRRILAPIKFKKNITRESMKGVYTPCFTFDSITTSLYEGKIGITHTRTVGSGKNQHIQTWVEWRYISGTYYDNFDDILITAGSKFDQTKLNKISPYNTNNGKKYTDKYLLGFMAYHYDNDLESCWGSAKGKMDELIKRRILKQYHYDRIAYFNVSTKHERVTYKYAMLPVYIGNYTYKSKLYNYYVNGENGKVWGKTPVSIFWILFFILLGLLVVAGIVYFVAIK